MNLLDLIQAVLMLGAPLAALSWFMFSWLFNSGSIDRQDDHKSINASLKRMKKSGKSSGPSQGSGNYVYDKWMWFGSGFYGLAGLWTFVVLEALQFVDFLFNFPGFDALFGNGLISFVVNFLVNQLGNVIQAFVWFSYWPADSMLLWVVVAYLGYWAGVELARRGVVLPVQALLQQMPASIRGAFDHLNKD